MIVIESVLARGDKARLELLKYCVMSVTPEPVFVFVAGEFRLRPTPAGAFAIFDVFCAEHAPARLAAHAALPPRELQLAAVIAHLRSQAEAAQEDDSEDAPAAVAVRREIFDMLVRAVREDPTGAWARTASTFDPSRAPLENLPGGRMNATQRHFVERVWQPLVRPRLTAAGFWQLATV